MTAYVIKTSKGFYAVRDSDLGLAASWSNNREDAFKFSEERADFWIRRINAYGSAANYAVKEVAS